MDEELTRYRALDAELVSLVKDIKMLSTLSWPKRMQDQFLADWRAGRHQLPQVEYKKFNYADRRHALKNIAHQCDAAHPVGNYLQRTAHSWQVATLLLDHPRVLGALAWSTLVLELGAPVALLGGWWARAWAVSAWGFHLGVVLLMAIVFPYPLVGVAYAPLLAVERPPQRVLAWWRRRRGGR